MKTIQVRKAERLANRPSLPETFERIAAHGPQNGVSLDDVVEDIRQH